jgi:ribosome recycling factor
MDRQPYYEMCAGKWFADHEQANDLSDVALTEAYQHCVAPPNPNDYPQIREAIEKAAIQLGIVQTGQLVLF